MPPGGAGIAPCQYRGRSDQHAGFFNELNDGINAVAGFHIAHHKWPILAHALSVLAHDIQRSADIRSQIGFVDNQQI